MRLDYTLLDPTGNITLLVDTIVPVEQQPAAASALMALEPEAEQVGFVAPGADGIDLCLRMAGGEFCGNASMSAAAGYAADHNINGGTLLLRVSGADKPVPVKLCTNEERYFGSVGMPAPLSVSPVTLNFDGQEYAFTCVCFPGISHLITETAIERRTAEKAIRLWCRELNADGLGIMQIDSAAGILTPLVYIPGADTLFWEHSCASGTTAAGYALARGESYQGSFREPGGTLSVCIADDGNAFLAGTVRILHRGSLDLSL